MKNANDSNLETPKANLDLTEPIKCIPSLSKKP